MSFSFPPKPLIYFTKKNKPQTKLILPRGEKKKKSTRWFIIIFVKAGYVFIKREDQKRDG